MNVKLLGLIAAPHTPFNSEGEVDLSVIDTQADWLHAQGVSGAFICGTTGEGVSLTVAERKAIAQSWVQAARGRIKIIVHVGHSCLADACELARHATTVSPYAISAMPPYFFKPATVDTLVDTCAMIAAAAPSLPFYYYHIPSMTGVTLSMTAFLAAGAERIATLRGIKFTHNDLMEYRQCLTLDGGAFDIPFGRDELLLSGLALGAQSAVGSTYNYAAPHYLKIIRAYHAGDFASAQRWMDEVPHLIAVLRDCGEMAAAKAIMTALGVPCGAPRLPLKPLTAIQERHVAQFVGSWSGFQHNTEFAHASKAL